MSFYLLQHWPILYIMNYLYQQSYISEIRLRAYFLFLVEDQGLLYASVLDQLVGLEALSGDRVDGFELVEVVDQVGTVVGDAGGGDHGLCEWFQGDLAAQVLGQVVGTVVPVVTLVQEVYCLLGRRFLLQVLRGLVQYAVLQVFPLVLPDETQFLVGLVDDSLVFRILGCLLVESDLVVSLVDEVSEVGILVVVVVVEHEVAEELQGEDLVALVAGLEFESLLNGREGLGVVVQLFEGPGFVGQQGGTVSLEGLEC